MRALSAVLAALSFAGCAPNKYACLDAFTEIQSFDLCRGMPNCAVTPRDVTRYAEAQTFYQAECVATQGHGRPLDR